MNDGTPVLVPLQPRSLPQRLAKRALDVVGASLGLALVSPIIAAAAAATKATSAGPAFFHWRIAGLGGRPVLSYKVRTMVVDAEALRSSLQARNEMGGPFFKMRDDPRITTVGRFLRRYSIDELPQLWSVLWGDLSLVGPRPPQYHEFLALSPAHRRKLSVKPGLTCTWQVHGRHRISSLDEWMQMDLDYIDNWSLWLDLKILAATIPVVLRGSGQ